MDVTIDPRLFDDDPTQIQPRGQPDTLPSRNLDNADDASDEQAPEGSGKRRKLNLLKCKQCRDARKKVESTCDLPLNVSRLTYVSASPLTVSGHRSVIVVVNTNHKSLSVRNPS